MIYKLCNKCHKMIPAPNTYCDRCKRAYELQQARQSRQANTIYNQKRNKKYTRFYNSKGWKQLSAAKLQDVGYQCQHQGTRCTNLAVEVHHIDPIQTDTGWERRLDYDNLQAVCLNCHNEHHKRFGFK